jgi:hypothetical protein
MPPWAAKKNYRSAQFGKRGLSMGAKEAALYLVSNFAATLTAIIALSAATAKIKPLGNALKRFFFAELYAADEKQDRRLNNLEMQQLKQIICDRRLPIGERLNAGKEYISRGGNGEIQMIYETINEAARKKRLEEEDRFERTAMENRREL